MILTYDQLNTSLLSTITTISGYQHQLKVLMNLLYLTGIRPVESLDRDRWSVLESGQVQLITAKNSGLRLFDSSDLPSEFYDDLQNERWTFDHLRISQAMYYFEKLWLYAKSSVGGKKVGLYSFRYRFVKSLVLDGYSDEEIRLIMGWSVVQLVSRYNGAQIVY